MMNSNKANSPSFLASVRDQLPHFSPSERRLAELVIDFPGELASYNASEIATMAGVSNATVTRFVRRIGYANYEAARQQVRVDGETGAALYRIKLKPDDSAFVATHEQQAEVNLQQTFSKLVEAEIDELAQALISARQVLLVGTRVGRVFSDYLGFQLSQFRDFVSVAPPIGETLGETLAGIGPEDCIVVFRLRRPNQQFDDMVKVTKRTGAKLLYITDEHIDRRTDMTWHIQAQTAATGPLFNHVAVIALCNLIATRAFALSGQAGRKRMRDIEATHQSLKEV